MKKLYDRVDGESYVEEYFNEEKGELDGKKKIFNNEEYILFNNVVGKIIENIVKYEFNVKKILNLSFKIYIKNYKYNIFKNDDEEYCINCDKLLIELKFNNICLLNFNEKIEIDIFENYGWEEYLKILVEELKINYEKNNV